MRGIAQLLGVHYPVIQGAMGVISSLEMVAALFEAGGIGNSKGFRAVLAPGAGGVQMGTRFIGSHECVAYANYKKGLCEGKETDTVLVEIWERD